MPGVTVYLPDDLHAQVKQYDIGLAPICQAALRKEITRLDTARRAATSGLAEVVERLRGTINNEEAQVREDGRKAGDMWARELATWSELEQIDELEGEFEIRHGEDFFSLADTPLWAGLGNTVSIRVNTAEPDWQGLVEGAVAVREAARTLLG